MEKSQIKEHCNSGKIPDTSGDKGDVFIPIYMIFTYNLCIRAAS